jgi:hypothetical protein
MSSFLEFKNDCISLLDRYNINSFTWSQFIPLDDDITFELNINLIDDKSFSKLDMISKIAWESVFKLISSYNSNFLSKQFGNNVQVKISRSEIEVSEFFFN